MFDVNEIRERFPLLGREVYGKPLIYLDNTATTQVPRSVVDAIDDMYLRHKANVHRGVHRLSIEATDLQEATREKVRDFIGAASVEEVIFTRGTTEAINLVASSYGGTFLGEGDEVLLTVMEHHADIVPWQLLERGGALAPRIPERGGALAPRIVIKAVPITADGSLDMEAFRAMLTPRTRLVACTHVSNVLGTLNPVREIIAEAHRHGAVCLIDGAQAVGHLRVDVRELDADFYVFSAHKMYGPQGVGVLYGRRELLQKMPPWQGGGEMIARVSLTEGTTFAELPFKFEAGTPDFVDIAAFATAIDFIREVGIEEIAAHEHELLEYTTARMLGIPGMRIFGTAPGKAAIISFLIGHEHHYDIGLLLDRLGVAVRTGHHCAQPLMDALGITGTVRASFAVYNTRADADAFLAALRRVAAMLGQ